MIVFLNFTALHRFWGSVEYRRFTEKKSGLFPDNTFNCGNAFAALQALGLHLGELALRMLTGARTNVDHRLAVQPLYVSTNRNRLQHTF